MSKRSLKKNKLVFDKKIKDRNKLPVLPQLALLALLLLAIFGSTITPKILAFLEKNHASAASVIQSQKDISQTIVPPANTVTDNPFTDMKVAGKAAYVWDVRDQKALFKKNESEQLPLASVTKLMTGLISQEILSENHSVTITQQAVDQYGDSGLYAGEKFDRLALSDFSLMSSSNDGAFALAEAAGNVLVPGSGAAGFVNAMNVRAKQLGLTETYYKNPTGLDISTTQAGAFGSARDMAFLMEYIIKNEPGILTYTTDATARVYNQAGQYHDADNTDYYVNQIPGLIGSKTGYTDLAGGNLIVAFNVGLNHPIIAVVLGSTEQDRFTDILKLVKATKAYEAQETAQ